MQRKRISITVLALGLLIITTSPVSAKDKARINGSIAVLPVSAPAALKLDRTILNEISEIFCEALLKEKFRVHSTSYLSERLSDKGYALDELANNSKYREIGDLVGLRYLLKGTILEWENHAWFGHEGRLGLGMQILDAQTGEVLWSSTEGKTITVFESKSMVTHLKRMIKKMVERIQLSS